MLAPLPFCISTTTQETNMSIHQAGDHAIATCGGRLSSEGAFDEFTVYDCDHESLEASSDFQEWRSQIVAYVAARIGCLPKRRMYAYERGARTIVAFDIFTEQPGNDVSITIQISADNATLTRPIDGQLDITLPSLSSVIDLISRLSSCHRQDCSHPSHHLEFLP